jgi:hypothetical protein
LFVEYGGKLQGLLLQIICAGYLLEIFLLVKILVYLILDFDEYFIIAFFNFWLM